MDNFTDLTFEGLDMDPSDQPFLDRNTTAFQDVRPTLVTDVPSKSTSPVHTSSPVPDLTINPDNPLKRKKSIASGSKRRIRLNTESAPGSSKFPTSSHTSSLENPSSHLQGEDINRESLARRIRQQKTPESHDPITFLNKTPTKTTSQHNLEKSPEHTPSPPLFSSQDPPFPKATPSPLKNVPSPLPKEVRTDPDPTIPASSQTTNPPAPNYSQWISHEITMSPFIGPNSSHSSQYDPNQPFIPHWQILNKDSVLDVDIARQFLHHATTPKDLNILRQLSPMDFSNGAHLNHAQSIGWFSEMHRRWVEAEMKVQQLSHEIRSIQEANASIHQLEQQLELKTEALQKATAVTTSLQNELDLALRVSSREVTKTATLKQEKEQLEIRLHETLTEHEKTKKDSMHQISELISKLQTSEQTRSELNKRNEEKDRTIQKLEEKLKTHEDQASLLQKEKSELNNMKEWLFSDGLGTMARKIVKSPELVNSIALVNSRMRQLGYKEGVIAGYSFGSRGKPINEVHPPVDEGIQSKVLSAVRGISDVQFRLVSDLQGNPQISLPELQKLLNTTAPSASKSLVHPDP
ncbi:hypothetical protein QVD17_15518 [Tagetes erecta]|uniref:Uncharacterized protein n=1 Tax=Tagetes erecta TaxID=13708 RepID=A0AAD8KPZ5_TARER|nr:hypothetical protein QVD17_15518 [Tagetes erecta]